MNIVQGKEEKNLVKKIISIFLGFFLIQLVIGSILIYQVATKQTTEFLQQISKRVQEDLSYQNGHWDIHKYIADPQTPGTYPLYILSADGFVIDRWKPAHGFLDTSDVNRLLSYQTPQTVIAPTNQSWRILSQPIIEKGAMIGVITVSSFNPSSANMSDIDTNLRNSISAIQSKISVTHNTIDTTKLDVRDINFTVAFQIVDRFNRIIIKNNNTNSIDQIPNYTDTSYIGNIINGAPVREITDDTTNEKFLITTTPIIDGNNTIIGVIVVGRSTSYISQILENFAIAEGCLGLVLVGLGSFITIIFVRKYAITVKDVPMSVKPEIHHISFDKKAGSIVLDHDEIVIPYATNQYYLCETLFSNPKKRWELDELLEKFGEQDLTNWRKVYDAMVITNKKIAQYLDEKLIIVRDKTYQINPKLMSKLS